MVLSLNVQSGRGFQRIVCVLASIFLVASTILFFAAPTLAMYASAQDHHAHVVKSDMHQMDHSHGDHAHGDEGDLAQVDLDIKHQDTAGHHGSVGTCCDLACHTAVLTAAPTFASPTGYLATSAWMPQSVRPTCTTRLERPPRHGGSSLG